MPALPRYEMRTLLPPQTSRPVRINGRWAAGKRPTQEGLHRERLLCHRIVELLVPATRALALSSGNRAHSLGETTKQVVVFLKNFVHGGIEILLVHVADLRRRF